MMDLGYEPLPAGNCTRILHVWIPVHADGLSTTEFECRFEVICLGPGTDSETPPMATDFPCYTAISYCWGDLTPNLRLKFDNGQSLPISQTLRDLLDSLKSNFLATSSKPASEFYWKLWIDAVCINQADIGERESQVDLMGRIYYSANAVLIWLGASTPESRRLFRTDRSKNDHENHDAEDFNKLLARPWFRRTWVVQEIALNRRVCLLCGANGQTLDWLMDRVRSFITYASNRRVVPDVVSNAVTLLSARDMFLRSDGQGLCWAKLAMLASSLEATDLRDKVYAFRGIAERTQRSLPKPNYDPPCPQMMQRVTGGDDSRIDDSMVEAYNKAVNRVFTEHAQAVLCDGSSLDMLCIAGESRRDGREGLPTWVPDLSRYDPNWVLFTAENNGWNAGGSLVRAATPVPGSACMIRLLARGFDVVDTVCAPLEVHSVEAQQKTMEQLMALRGQYFGHMSDEEWNDMLCDALRYGLNHKRGYRGHEATYKKFYRASFDIWLARLQASTSEDDMAELMEGEFLREMKLLFPSGWRLFATRNGLLGVGPPKTLAGDLIFIIPGCRQPLLFRPLREDSREKETMQCKPRPRVGENLISLVPGCRPDIPPRFPWEGGTLPCMRLQHCCYVYGAMFGEKESWGFKEWELDVE